MATTNPLASHPDSANLRKEAGAYLKKVREKAGISQNELAKKVGIDYYTMISQVEGGKVRLPPDKMQGWADAVQVDPETFAKTLLRFYDPFTWEILFGGKKRKA
jgi:transcriptional regulator with XRE-family HTH domain